MQALILAAGMGKRLGKLTKNNTKCMVEVNGVTLIERMLGQLENCSFSRIVIVVGYHGDVLKKYIENLEIKTPIIFVENDIYDKTNNIYSLFLAKQYLCEEDTILLESDLIFEDKVLQLLLEDSRDTLALVDKYESWMDGTCIKIGENDSIDTFVPGSKFVFEDIPNYYKTVNIYKFSKHFSEAYYVPFLEAYSHALGNNEYYEQVLRVITMLDEPYIYAKKLDGQLWYEIDDVQDLDIAASMFAKDSKHKLCQIKERKGGYWRYPAMLDFAHPTNPLFPPKKLLNEMKANMDTLITAYPSNRDIVNLLASKNFGVNYDYIMVGQGTEELFKCLLQLDLGRIGIIVPTIAEYLKMCKNRDVVCFNFSEKEYRYSVNDLRVFCEEKEVKTLLLLNPDYPTGNCILKQELLAFMDWCCAREISVILDETYADFAEGEDNSFLIDEIMDCYPNLIILKSLSQSYGIPGLCLGILACADKKLVKEIRMKLSFAEMNSVSEFFMQIAEKYVKDHRNALSEFKKIRRTFLDEVAKIAGVRFISTAGNYVMIKVPDGYSSATITELLLERYHILVENLCGLPGIEEQGYLCVAIKGEKENQRLLEVLKEVCNS